MTGSAVLTQAKADSLNLSSAIRPIGDAPLSIDDVADLAQGRIKPTLSPMVLDRMARSAEVMTRLHARGSSIYGVTTSVGASVDTHVPPERAAELSLNIMRMHGCGTGRLLDDVEAAAVLAVRLASLSQGKSGVRPVIAERLVDMLSARMLPRIPCEGSVGASGDLTPLSYVTATLVGEREVSFQGTEMPAHEALKLLQLEPLTLAPKEALALMNGTSVATALSCLAWIRAQRIARLSSTVCAMACIAIEGNPEHFDPVVHDAKPHPGQRQVAEWIAHDMQGIGRHTAPQRLQDRYSIRCAPHVIGVLVDALRSGQEILETELNGVSDNPIIDVQNERILHGGNFYGGHVAHACDFMKTAVANVACLLDRQIMLVCNPLENAGLPANLVGMQGEEASTHNGFKAVTIAASALAAESLKLSMPASAFSRSTELHNQDKVPMATMAARDLLRIVDLSERVLSMATLVCTQALELRLAGQPHPHSRPNHASSGPHPALGHMPSRAAERMSGVAPHGFIEAVADSPAICALVSAVREQVPFLREDRRLDQDIAHVVSLMHHDHLGSPVRMRPAGQA